MYQSSNFNYSIFIFNFNLTLVLYTKINTNGYIERMLFNKKKHKNALCIEKDYFTIYNYLKLKVSFNLCVGFRTFHYLKFVEKQKSVSVLFLNQNKII